MTLICNICKNKEFKTESGLWKHNNNYHNTIKKKTKSEEPQTYKCEYCDKIFGYYQSRWRHEQKCKPVHQIPLVEKVQKLEAEISELKANKVIKPDNITNNTTNNTTNNNNITNNIQLIVNPLGTESISHLSLEKQKEILNAGPNGLLKLIEYINFNKNIPENHTYCITSLNGSHASVIDINTNKIIKKEKTEVFDKILSRSLGNLENLSNNKKVSSKDKENGKDTLDRIKKTVILNNKGMKKYYNEINTISYNNKDMILETWISKKTQEDNTNILEKINNEKDKAINENQKAEESDESSDSDTDSDSDDGTTLKSHKYVPAIESDDEEIDQVEITIKNTKYILEGPNVYFIFNNKKAQLYGTFANGKVKKIQKIEINL
jgi:hypothetical protein